MKSSAFKCDIESIAFLGKIRLLMLHSSFELSEFWFVVVLQAFSCLQLIKFIYKQEKDYNLSSMLLFYTFLIFI
jgi:hypothetical protein